MRRTTIITAVLALGLLGAGTAPAEAAVDRPSGLWAQTVLDELAQSLRDERVRITELGVHVGGDGWSGGTYLRAG